MSVGLFILVKHVCQSMEGMLYTCLVGFSFGFWAILFLCGFVMTGRISRDEMVRMVLFCKC